MLRLWSVGIIRARELDLNSHISVVNTRIVQTTDLAIEVLFAICTRPDCNTIIDVPFFSLLSTRISTEKQGTEAVDGNAHTTSTEMSSPKVTHVAHMVE